MRVLIDDAPFRPPLTGVGRYAVGLVGAVAALTRAVDFAVLSGRRLVKLEEALGPAPSSAGAGSSSRLSPRLLELPGALAFWRAMKGHAVHHGRGFDLYHALNFQPACRVHCPLLPVVHDLAHERIAQHVSDRIKRVLAPLEGQLRHVPLVQTVSEFTKREIVEIYGLSADRIVVVRAGVAVPAGRPSGPAAQARMLDRFGLRPRAFFLTVGSAGARKNLAVAIAAYARLPARLRLATPLVMAGPPSFESSELLLSAERLGIGRNIQSIGFVDEAKLDALYRNASMLLFPSIYEGYGLPVAEALARGTPVAIAPGTAAEEAAQGRAVLVESRDVEGWTEVMRLAIDDPDLCRERASGYELRPWAAAATEVLGVYARVMQIAGGPARTPGFPRECVTV